MISLSLSTARVEPPGHGHDEGGGDGDGDDDEDDEDEDDDGEDVDLVHNEPDQVQVEQELPRLQLAGLHREVEGDEPGLVQHLLHPAPVHQLFPRRVLLHGRGQSLHHGPQGTP